MWSARIVSIVINMTFGGVTGASSPVHAQKVQIIDTTISARNGIDVRLMLCILRCSPNH
jgi:hypothetical protein